MVSLHLNGRPVTPPSAGPIQVGTAAPASADHGPRPPRPPVSSKVDVKELITTLAALAAAAGVVLYGIGRATSTAFYAPFGIDPERLGITRTRLVPDLAMVAGLILLPLAGAIAVGVLQYQLTRHARPEGLRSGAGLGAQGYLRPGVLIMGPLALVFLLLKALPPGSVLQLAASALAMVAALSFWGSLGAEAVPARTRVEEAAIPAVVFAALAVVAGVGIREPSTRGALVLGLFLAVALALSLRTESQSAGLARIRSLCLSLALPALLVLVAAATAGLLAAYVGFLVQAAVLGWMVAFTDPGAVDEGVRRRAFPRGAPRIGLPLGIAAGAVMLTLGAFALWSAAAEEGQDLYDTGRIPTGLATAFAGRISPAHVMPLGDDPLNVCDGSRVAILLGEADGGAQVFWFPARPGPGQPPKEVLVMPADEYSVGRAVAAPMTCTTAP